MFLAAFTSAFALCPQATHTKVAWLLRLSDAMCLQVLQVCDVYAAFTFSTRPEAFCSNRPASRPHPDLRMPRLSPAFCATFLPGFCTVPAAEPVMPLTLRFSTRITSNLRARSVLVFSSQSLRRSLSLAFNRPIRVLTFLRRFDPRRARASLRCSRRSRSASFARKPLGLVISPVDSATATVTPRSTPTTPPVPGAGIGSGITANAICQRPARSRVMRYDFQCMRARLRLNCSQPILGTSTLDRARLSRRTRNPAGPTIRKPSSSPALRHVGRLWVPAKNLCHAWSRSRNACCWTVCDPQASHGAALRAAVNCAALGPQPGGGPFSRPPHPGLLKAEVPHVSGVAALLQQEHFLCSGRVQRRQGRTGRCRRPGQRRLPALLLLDQDRPARPGPRQILTRRPCPGPVLGRPATQTQTPTDCGDLAARPAQPARTLPAVWGTAALRGPPTRLPHPVGDLVPGHPQGAGPRGHHRTRQRPDDTPPRTRPLRPTSPRRPGAGSRPVDARCLPAHAGCLSRVPR